jgi:hypothetical protein
MKARFIHFSASITVALVLVIFPIFSGNKSLWAQDTATQSQASGEFLKIDQKFVRKAQSLNETVILSNIQARQSSIPLARPKNEQQPRQTEPLKPQQWSDSNNERYYLKDDPETWPGAVHEFGQGLKAEFDNYRESGISRLDWQLEEILDYVDNRLYTIADEQTELNPVDENNLALAFIEEYLLENLSGLAIDEEGHYFMMFNESDEEAEWLPTPINAYSSAPTKGPTNDYYFPGNLRPQSQDEEMTHLNNLRRYDAAKEAWN